MNSRSYLKKLELIQFIRNDILELISRFKDHSVVGTIWEFKNKMNDSKVMIRDKGRLIAKEYNQIKGIHFKMY